MVLEEVEGKYNPYLHKTAESLAKPLYASSKVPLCFEVSNTLVKKPPMLPNWKKTVKKRTELTIKLHIMYINYMYVKT